MKRLQNLGGFPPATWLTHRHFFHSCFDKSEMSPESTPHVLLRTVGMDMVYKEWKRCGHHNIIHLFSHTNKWQKLTGHILTFFHCVCCFCRQKSDMLLHKGPAWQRTSQCTGLLQSHTCRAATFIEHTVVHRANDRSIISSTNELILIVHTYFVPG